MKRITRKILIVEDEVLIREGWATISWNGYEVFWSRRWAVGEPDLLYRETPDLYLLGHPASYPQWLEVPLRSFGKTSSVLSSCWRPSMTRTVDGLWDGRWLSGNPSPFCPLKVRIEAWLLKAPAFLAPSWRGTSWILSYTASLAGQVISQR